MPRSLPLPALVASALLLLLSTLSSAQSPLADAKWNADEKAAGEFLVRAEDELQKAVEKKTFVDWDFESNITDANEKRKLDEQRVIDALLLKLGDEAKALQKDSIQDEVLKRKLTKLALIGTSRLPKDKLEKFNQLATEMGKIYSTAKVANQTDPSHMLSLEPELTEVLAKSRDPKELEYYWKAWRDVSGKKMRKQFIDVIDLTNEAARLNGLKHGAELKNFPYESPTFVNEMEEVWNGLKPLYQKLHAYTRHKLQEKYGKEIVPDNAPMPAHLLGNMWAQSWNNLADILRPYPNKPDIDVSDKMKEKGWTAKKMFELADEFFQSLGLEPMRPEFWNGSLIEKPTDGRELVCHASAWDFYNGKDFRIKMCTKIEQEDFIVVNHEMGHTQYQMSYRNQSYLFRDGANPGFHEGVADILSLAVGTAGYFKKLGLLDDSVDVTDQETDINILFNMALQRLVFMPFAYVVDKFRWDLYTGDVKPDDLNCHWVKLRADIQGVAPPVTRTESDFDAGSKYHVANDIEYIRYFTAHIYEFQFYRELCKVSNQYVPGDKDKPLHRCNFYGSKEAGTKLFEMLSLGASKPWTEVMRVMTGEPKLDTQAYRDYFAPLEAWLDKYAKDHNIVVGWGNPDYGKLCTAGGDSSSSTTPGTEPTTSPSQSANSGSGVAPAFFPLFVTIASALSLLWRML